MFETMGSPWWDGHLARHAWTGETPVPPIHGRCRHVFRTWELDKTLDERYTHWCYVYFSQEAGHARTVPERPSEFQSNPTTARGYGDQLHNSAVYVTGLPRFQFLRFRDLSIMINVNDRWII
jgi:hypothetical protein